MNKKDKWFFAAIGFVFLLVVAFGIFKIYSMTYSTTTDTDSSNFDSTTTDTDSSNFDWSNKDDVNGFLEWKDKHGDGWSNN